MRTAVAFLLVVSFAALLVGCGAPSATDVLKNTATAYRNAKTLVLEQDAQGKMEFGGKQNSYKATLALSFQRPDKARMEVRSERMSYVLASNGKKTYVHAGRTAVWQELPKETAKAALSGGTSGLSDYGLLTEADPFKKVKNAKVTGSEKIGGVDTYVVQFDLPIEMRGMKGSSKAKMWVGKADWLIRKSEIVLKMDMGGPRPGGKAVPGGRPVGSMTSTTTVVTRKVKTNSTIDPALFSPPKGAKMRPMGIGGSGH